MKFVTVTTIALLACPVAGLAQEAEPGSVIRTLVTSGGFAPDEMRSAGPANDPSGWLTPSDVPEVIRTAAAGKVAGPRHQITLAQVGLKLTVEVDDRTSDCSGAYGQTDLAPQLCTLIRERGRFRHALTFDGVPVRREATITIQYSLNGSGSDVGLPPAPSGGPWPVMSHSGGVTMESEPEWRRFGRDRDGRLTGIALTFRNGQINRCWTIKPSGNDKLDTAACAAVRTAKYNVAASGSYASLPLLVRWSRDGATVRLPVKARWEGPSLTAGDPIIRGLRGSPAAVWLNVAASGTVTRCRVAQSSGSDGTDVAMCRAMSAMSFNPARDVFGEAIDGFVRTEVRFE